MGWRGVQEGGGLWEHTADSLVLQQKITQHCKVTISQFKKKKKRPPGQRFDELLLNAPGRTASWVPLSTASPLLVTRRDSPPPISMN